MSPFFAVLIVFSLCAPASAEAGNKVLFFGDSMTLTGSGTHQEYPALVMAARPDLTDCVDSVNGRNTQEGLATIDAALDACAGVTDTVFLLAVADLLDIPGSTPMDTATRLRLLADHAIAHGSRAWIMTPPPAPVWTGTITLDGQSYTRDVAAALSYLNGSAGVGHGTILPARDEFTKVTWASTNMTPPTASCVTAIGKASACDAYTSVSWSACSSDNLHPTGLACRQALAKLPIAAIPVAP